MEEKLKTLLLILVGLAMSFGLIMMSILKPTSEYSSIAVIETETPNKTTNENRNQIDPFVHIKEHDTPKTKYETKEFNYKKGIETPDQSMVRLTGNLVYIGIFQFIVFAIQAVFMWKTLGRMNKTEGENRIKDERGSRAYVHIRKQKIFGDEIFNRIINSKDPNQTFPIESPLTFEFRIRNYGNTPATKVHWFATVKIIDVNPLDESIFEIPRKTDEEIERDLKTNLISMAIMPPNDTEGYVQKLGLDGCLMEEDVNGIRNKKKAIFIYGRIDYTDVFNIKRETNFRYVYVKPDGYFSQRLSVCEKGNDIT